MIIVKVQAAHGSRAYNTLKDSYALPLLFFLGFPCRGLPVVGYPRLGRVCARSRPSKSASGRNGFPSPYGKTSGARPFRPNGSR